MADLLVEITRDLKRRTPSERKSIAEAAGVSASMVEQIGRGHYKSCPTYKNITAIAKAIRRSKQTGEAAA
jgi:predicted transcriptional regulator